MLTLAPLTAPPVASVIVPRIRPPVLCAKVVDAQTTAHHTASTKRERMLPNEDVRRNCFGFIDSPLRLKGLILHRVFEVAALRKPYYNPVNLWNARGDVKKKEFIRAIGFALVCRLFAHQRSRASRWHFFLCF